MYREIINRIIPREAGNAEKYVLRDKLFGTTDVLPMWVADMDIVTPPFVTRAVMERASHPIYGYEMMPKSAFEVQASWLLRRFGYQVSPDDMRYSPSVVATINMAIASLTKPGDKVIVQPPVYPPFMKAVTQNGRQLLRNPLRQDAGGIYRFDLEDLERQIDGDTRLLLLCSPHNPVGRVWERHELESLLALCLKYGISVLADEIHADLVFAPHRHTPFASLSSEAEQITLTASGPGKTFNMAGLSASTVIIANEQLRERFDVRYRQVHFGEGNIFAHVAFEAAYREGEAWVDALMRQLEANVTLLQKHLPEGLTCKRPEGTYLAWLDARGWELSDRELRERFIERAKLGLSPGISFGKEGSGFMRLNFAVPEALMQEACRRLDNL